MPTRLLASTAGIVVSVVAVVALLVLPGWFAGSASTGPGQPQPPRPARTLGDDTPGTRDWTALACPGGEVGCVVPTSLNLGGVRFVRVRGHEQEISRSDPSTRTLTRTVRPAGGKRWVLVGAEGANSSSEITLRLGGSASAPVPAGTLSLLSVPDGRGPVEVTVADYGRPSGREVLHIEEYDASS